MKNSKTLQENQKQTENLSSAEANPAALADAPAASFTTEEAPGDHQSRVRGNPAKASVKEDPPEPPKPTISFAQIIYDKITSIFGQGAPTQMFSLCWPGTVLDAERMGWTPEEMIAGNMPERALARASQILDAYVPLGQITQPDGTKVSDRYRAALMQMGPLPNRNIIQLQQVVRSRLQKEVEVDIGGTRKTMRLIDYYQHLTGIWMRDRSEWARLQSEAKDNFRIKYSDSSSLWWDAYLAWYADNAPAWVSRINLAYDNVIAEFPVTEWQDAMAILDISDDAGLAEAKSIMRNAVVSLPRQEGTSYAPAFGVPYDWPQRLKKSTRYLDLLADPEAQIRSIDNTIAMIQKELMTWAAIIPRFNDKDVQEAYTSFQEAFDTAHKTQTEFTSEISRNTFDAVQMVCDYMASRGGVSKETDAGKQTKLKAETNDLINNLNESNPDGKKPANEVDWAKLKDYAEKISEGNQSLIAKQQQMTAAGRKLAGAALNYLNKQANSSNFTWVPSYIASLQAQLDNLVKTQGELKSASNRYYEMYRTSVALEGNDRVIKPAEFGKDAFASPLDAPENRGWKQVEVTIDSKSLSAESDLNTVSKSSQWNVDFFLGAGGGTNEETGANFATEFMTNDSKIQIGFLAMKVLIDRPWMKAEIFRNTDKMFRSNGSPLAPSRQFVHSELLGEQNQGNLQDLVGNNVFPSYPIAILLAKDITVKINISAAKTKDIRDRSRKVKSEGGGFLLFSYNKQEASEGQNDTMNSYAMAGQFVARVAAPQIVGYWSQLLPPDNSKPLDLAAATEIAEALSFSDNLKALSGAPRETVLSPRALRESLA